MEVAEDKLRRRTKIVRRKLYIFIQVRELIRKVQCVKLRTGRTANNSYSP